MTAPGAALKDRVACDARNLDEDLLDLAVVDNGGVAPRALAETALRIPSAAHAHSTREETCAVGDELNFFEVAWIKRVAVIFLLLFHTL